MPLINRILLYRGAFVNLPTLAQGELAFCTDTKEVWIGDGVINRRVGNDPVTDGDKGGITVSDGGDTWTINARTVGAAELAAVTSQRVLGRNTAGAGDVEEVTIGQLLDWFSSTPGGIPTRSASAWSALAPTAAGQEIISTLVSGSNVPAYVQRGQAYFTDEKSAGTNGGTFTAGAWQLRDLNRSVFNNAPGCSLSSNQILLDIGEWEIFARAPAAAGVLNHQCIFAEIGPASAEYGSCAYATANAQTDSFVRTRVTVASNGTAFGLYHRCNTTIATFGFGAAVNFAGAEVYSSVLVTRWK